MGFLESVGPGDSHCAFLVYLFSLNWNDWFVLDSSVDSASLVLVRVFMTYT